VNGFDRRGFLRGSALALAGAMLPRPTRAAGKLTIVVLGGTGFIGPHIVEAALARGHVPTLFNRGKTNPQLFPELEKLRGDRRGDLAALEGRSWDAVVDTSGYVPIDVTRSAKLLAQRVGHYLYVSTTSVYAKLDRPGLDETAPLATIDDPTTERVTGDTYGALKALCEQAAEAELPGRTTNLRPGLVVGPGDPTDRFTYWPARFDRGGEVLAPNAASDPTQFIDARDLAQFIVHALEHRVVGTYNVDAEPGALTIGEVIDASRAATRRDATATWVPAAFLESQGVAPWQDLPLWMPAHGDNAGFGQVSVAKAKAAGLTWRPLGETVRDTLAYYRSWPEPRRAKLRAGLAPEREAAVLAAWHAQDDTTA